MSENTTLRTAYYWENGDLWVAKFLSRNDDHDVGAWEMFACRLAESAGITVAKTQMMEVGVHHALLSRRFDRIAGKRIHFASAMCLLGLKDGDGAQSGHGYLDIAEFIIEHCADVEVNLEELFRRVAFNIAIGNCDDHFRNHGFLLTRSGWTLSPAFDLNPTTRENQSLLINDYTDKSDLNVLFKSASSYFLTKARAKAIIEEVVEAVAGWRSIAQALRLARSDAQRLGSRFVVGLKS
ncbi:MAG: HipA domain-containing protein [Duodenibacillus sp.]|nr:HipA domain-containing protein [Duodenibacillus sp.]